jgi:hypothetical protein
VDGVVQSKSPPDILPERCWNVGVGRIFGERIARCEREDREDHNTDRDQGDNGDDRSPDQVLKHPRALSLTDAPIEAASTINRLTVRELNE